MKLIITFGNGIFMAKGTAPGRHDVTSNFMDNITDIKDILKSYNLGHRYFLNLNFEKGEKLIDAILIDSIFYNCYFSADFSESNFTNAKFTSCNLKGTDFIGCNLTNLVFENCSLEEVNLKNAIVENISFSDCYCYGKIVNIDKLTNELVTNKDPLVRELYDFIPEFDKISNHFDDEIQYLAYGELSDILYEDITTNEKPTDFAKKCFQFFNILGDKHGAAVDDLLVVGVYEGLYSNKKCNDSARQLLTGRNKQVYEHWMKNGNIRADY